jgi:hypothetical protein
MLQKVSAMVESLEREFLLEGYLKKSGPKFFVQPNDRNGNPLLLTEEEKSGWDKTWIAQDKAFLEDCERNPDFHWMKDRKFAVFDGNHRLFAWSRVAAWHPKSLKFHPRVKCTMLKGDKEAMTSLEFAFIGINRYIPIDSLNIWPCFVFNSFLL